MDSPEVRKALMFLRSALTVENPYMSTERVKAWLAERNDEVTVEIEKIPFDAMARWSFAPDSGDLVHDSGKFFSITGVQVEANWGKAVSWSQPIINQPEIGFLGIITKQIDGVLYFLMQAKIEPGNVNNVQLSPTLQATKSNYTRVHKGKSPDYLEYFLDRERNEVLVDQLQSEQGARFLKKRNRNIIIEVSEDLEVKDDFCWLTLGQLKELIQEDNLVNMDSRTVISGIPYGTFDGDLTGLCEVFRRGDSLGTEMLKSAVDERRGLNGFDAVISWLTELKTRFELSSQCIPLKNVVGWTKTEREIHHDEGKYFKVIGVDVQITSREVTSWAQPLVEPTQEGLSAFVIQRKQGIIHFLVQGKVECGNFDIVEMAPTVQCITGNYRETERGALPFLEYVLNASASQKVYDTRQSEEGGRFYREQNRYLVIDAGEDDLGELPQAYIWLTLNQMITFLRYNNYLNIEARSLISAIRFV